ncbi:3'(2'),5'-bisphosphate nucleotidase CysQ [soil metagenome]
MLGNMFKKELEVAIKAARLASDAILEHYNDELIAENKIGVDNFDEPVTAADREASRIIVGALAEAFPADAILSEEEPDETERRLASERVWIIDPIDGTAGFIKHDGDFAVQIGLAVAGEPVVGVVLLPFHNVVYSAAKNGGSFAEVEGKTTVKLEVSDKASVGDLRLAVSRNHRSRNMGRIVDSLGIRHKVERGSVGLKIGLIADGVCDIYIHPSPRTKLWDTCGPQVILEEAGGRMTDLFGRRYLYDVRDLQNWGGIVASNGVAHDELITNLRPILNELGRFPVRSHAA